MTTDWDESAQAWIATMGTDGDWGRRHVLDRPMLDRISGRSFANALDLGCGEGRYCRMMQPLGIRTSGIDPTEALVERAPVGPTGVLSRWPCRSPRLARRKL